MASRPRLAAGGLPMHVVQRGVDRQVCFFSDEDRALYLELLADYGRATQCAIHAYVLMSNHVHLLLTPVEETGPSRLMQRLGQHFVKAVNRAYGRTGGLWEGRYRSTIATDEAYVLACYRYIEMNPVRARMVDHPRDYAWSSHRANADGAPVSFLEPHESYLALGGDAETRRVAYRELFRAQLPETTLTDIRRATGRNDVLGNDRFRAQVEAMLGRRVGPLKPGRPRKASPDVDG